MIQLKRITTEYVDAEDRIRLSGSDADGSAVILHLNPDRGQPGVTGASGGARIACGVIQLVSDDDDSFNIGR